MKFLSTIIAGAIVGALGVYFTLNWQEEKLEFSITAPAKFGSINYQNISLANKGWNPALNVKVFISHDGISFANIQSSSSIKKMNDLKNGIASIDRIRRDESLVLSLAYEGQPLSGDEIKIVSDRSIALLVENDPQYNTPLWMQILVGFFSFLFFIGVIAGIAIPQFKAYKKRAEEKSSNSMAQ